MLRTRLATPLRASATFGALRRGAAVLCDPRRARPAVVAAHTGAQHQGARAVVPPTFAARNPNPVRACVNLARYGSALCVSTLRQAAYDKAKREAGSVLTPI